MTFFSNSWWLQFIKELNQKPEKSLFSNLGKVRFSLIGQSRLSIVINFDSHGEGILIDSTQDSFNTFEATEENWRSFVKGDFTATMGVLSGKIIFKGNIFHILPYSNSFNQLAKAARPYTRD